MKPIVALLCLALCFFFSCSGGSASMPPAASPGSGASGQSGQVVRFSVTVPMYEVPDPESTTGVGYLVPGANGGLAPDNKAVVNVRVNVAAPVAPAPAPAEGSK